MNGRIAHGVQPCLGILEACKRGLHAGVLHRRNLHLLVFGHERREQRGDFRARTVTGHQLAGAYRFAEFAEQPRDVAEACSSRLDGLVGVAQQHEMGVFEPTGHGHQLAMGVVLYFVHHHVACMAVAATGQRHLQVQPFAGGKVLYAQYACSDAVHAQPVGVADHFFHGFVLAGQVHARQLLVLFFGGRLGHAAEDPDLVAYVQRHHLVVNILALRQALDARMQLV